MTASRLPPRVPEWIFRLDDPVAKQRQQMQVSARRPSPRSRPCLLLERDRPEAALARSPAVPTRRGGVPAPEPQTTSCIVTAAAGPAASAPSADAALVLAWQAEGRGQVAPRLAAAVARPVDSSRAEPG